jgi:uncharacterized membrane protein (UPF0127 family)
MGKERVFVFNRTRRSFLSLGADVADTFFGRLIGLRGQKALNADGGLWIVPARGVDTFGMVFPIDVVYLNTERQVVHVLEHLNPFRFGALKKNCQSVLGLPVRTIFQSQTTIGDQLTIGQASQLQQLIAIYADGGYPRSREIKHVTPDGAYLVTEDRWYPGTIVDMRVQYHPQYLDVARLNGHSSASIRMRARVVSHGKDGVGVDFVYLDKIERQRFKGFLARI